MDPRTDPDPDADTDDPRRGTAAPGAGPMLRRALAARAPGRSLLSPAAPASVADVHAGRAASLATLAASLDPHEWQAPTRFGRPVQAVLAHLLGQLERTATELGDGTFVAPAADDYDHWGVTEPFIERFGRGEPAALVAALAEVADRVQARCETLGGADDRATRALVQSYETWMHADDVRLSLGRAVDVPDPASLLALCNLAVGAVPLAVALGGLVRADAHARLVLTGPGGGVWVVALAPGEPAAPPGASADVTIVAEGHGFCRLLHRQVLASDVVADIEGDAALAAAVLATVGSLAERT